MPKKKKTAIVEISLDKNPLDAIADLDNLIKASTTTGIMTGAALASVHRGFTDNSISDRDRVMYVMRGAAFLGAQLFSTYRALEELISKRGKEKPKTQDLERLLKENEELRKEVERLKKELKKSKKS